MFNNFFTFAYKNGFIHTKYDAILKKEVVKYQLSDHSVHSAKSVHHAKIMISKSQKG